MSNTILNNNFDLKNVIVNYDPKQVLKYHQSFPEYQESALIDAPNIAEVLGVKKVWVKDESQRLGLPAFKILGASWAVARAISNIVNMSEEELTFENLKLKTQAFREQQPGRLEGLVAATDGNHGRAVARMAKHLDIACTIFVPDNTVNSRIEAIQSEGAEVVVHDGNYDGAVRAAAARANDHTLVIADTAWEGYEVVPRWVIDGYSTISQETLQQLKQRGEDLPNVVVTQMGVGAFASSVIENLSHLNPTFIGVEPEDVACVAKSIASGRLEAITGDLDSIMAGLNCGEPSPIAWPSVSAGLSKVILATDEEAKQAMRLLADSSVVAGESGAAGLAGLLHDSSSLSESDVVLLINTEGATDPEFYQRIISGQ